MLLGVLSTWKLNTCYFRMVTRVLWCVVFLSKCWLSYQLPPSPSLLIDNGENGSQCSRKDMQALTDFKNNITTSRPLNWHPNNNCCTWEGIFCEENIVTKLWLPERGLKGSLSSSLGSLEQLMELNLSYNLLSSAIPDELFSLQHLQVLDLSFNNLSGLVPTPKGLRAIHTFNISSNLFAQRLPGLGITSNLIALNVSNNSFTGLIPTNICKNSSSIRIIDFSLNEFGGTLNEGLGECLALEE